LNLVIFGNGTFTAEQIQAIVSNIPDKYGFLGRYFIKVQDSGAIIQNELKCEGRMNKQVSYFQQIGKNN